MRSHPGDAVAVGVRVAGQSRPGVQESSDVEDGEHEQVGVVEVEEVVEHPLAQPGVLRGGQTRVRETRVYRMDPSPPRDWTKKDQP